MKIIHAHAVGKPGTTLCRKPPNGYEIEATVQLHDMHTFVGHWLCLSCEKILLTDISVTRE